MSNKIYPFKFLDSYTAEDKDIFFGRDEEVRQLYQMIYQSDTLLLYGASGTGKTSLIQCGLASQFQQHDWLDVFIRRHKNLNESLQKALIAVGGQGENYTTETQDLDWLEELMSNESSTNSTKTLTTTQQFLKNIYLQHFRPIYLIFDQFEELFILGSEQEQNQFITTIQEILQVEQPVKLIFSIREEYLGSLYEFEKVVPELLHKKLRIDPMNLEKVKAVVLGATTSKKSIVHIKENEAGAIAEQVFEKIRGKEKTLTIQLPYLQVFLDKYYRHISKDKAKTPTTEATFTLAALAEIGDIGNILRDFLDEQIIEIANKQGCDHKTIWKILSPFVTVDGTKEPIGLAGLHQQLPEVPKKLVDHVVVALMNNRILRYIEEEDLYEIAHDSLALRIAEKRSDDDIALLEVRNLIKSQSLLKDEARELFSEKQLDFISPYLGLLPLNATEKQLIDESRAKVLQTQKEARRRKVLIALLILLIFAIILWFAFDSQKQKTQALKAQTLALQAEQVASLEKIKAEEAQKQAEYSERTALSEKEKAELAKEQAEKAKIQAYTSANQANIAQKIAEARKKQAEYAERNSRRKEVEALRAREAAQKEAEKAKKANEKNEKIINAMDFYEGDLALAFHDGKYGFINKEGEPVIDYEYDRGEPFDPETGFASMEIQSRDRETSTTDVIFKYDKYLVNPKGERYLLVTLSDLLKNRGNIKDVLSPTDLAFIKKQLGKKEKEISLFKKIDLLEEERDLAYMNLLVGLNRNQEKLAFDFADLSEEEVEDIIKKIELVGSIKDRVELLSFKRTKLKTFPTSIALFKNLKRLDITGAKFNSIPASISDFNQLERLDMRRSYITDIPSSIGQLQGLEVLYLPANDKDIPASIFELKNLRLLELGAINQSTLPNSIQGLQHLKELSMTAPLMELPDGLFKLKSLETLEIKKTQIAAIPQAIRQLNQLKVLSLQGPLKEIPKEVFELKKLSTLNLNKTKIEEIPAAIVQLDALKTLSIGGPIKAFPSGILELKKLHSLNLENTAIAKLPADIAQLQNLKVLYLSGPLENFPMEVFDLKKLEALKLYNAKLQVVPDNINELKQLKNLMLSGIFKEFPPSILQLKNLETLELKSDSLQAIPENIGDLSNLTSLNISGSYTKIPYGVFTLRKLVDLQLAYAEIESIPISIFNLKSLGILTLSGTFEKLPSEITALRSLKVISIYNFRNLKEIPDISKIKGLFLFTCIVYGEETDEDYQNVVRQLRTYKKQLPECTFLVADQQGDYIDFSSEED